MRRAAVVVALVALASDALADPALRVLTGGVRSEAGASVAGGVDSSGVVVWLDRADLNRTASLSYVYRWRGIASGTDKYNSLIRTPHFGLFFRSFDTFDIITQGGAALGMGLGFGLGLRAGTADGNFSLVASPLAAIDGFWVIREGPSGLSARVPLGAELGVEAKLDRLILQAAARPFVDVWPGRSPAYRWQAFASVGMHFDLPPPRKPGQPAPNGP